MKKGISRKGIVLGREVLTLVLIVFTILGVFWFASLGKLPSPTGNVVLYGEFFCVPNEHGVTISDANGTSFLEKTNLCIDERNIKEFSCDKSTASDWWSALFMSSSVTRECRSGCSDGSCNIEVFCIDNDGDGYGTGCPLGLDCNDDNILIHPNAIESCTDVTDNNCNNIINENCSRCGNGVVESGEDCDIPDFGGSSCSSLGFYAGTLKCSNECSFDTSLCLRSANSRVRVNP